MARTKFGHMACPDCSHQVVVRANERETLSYHCDECDSQGYARKDNGNYAAWLGRIKRAPGAAPDAPLKPPAEKPGEKKKDFLDGF